MSTPILATKLYIPPPRAKIVLRPRLIKWLNEGLQRKLILSIYSKAAVQFQSDRGGKRAPAHTAFEQVQTPS